MIFFSKVQNFKLNIILTCILNHFFIEWDKVCKSINIMYNIYWSLLYKVLCQIDIRTKHVLYLKGTFILTHISEKLNVKWISFYSRIVHMKHFWLPHKCNHYRKKNSDYNWELVNNWADKISTKSTLLIPPHVQWNILKNIKGNMKEMKTTSWIELTRLHIQGNHRLIEPMTLVFCSQYRRNGEGRWLHGLSRLTQLVTH